MAGSVVWVDVLPSMSKFGGTFAKQAGTAARTAGVSAAKQFSAGINAGAMKGSGNALAQELEAASKRVARAVQTEKSAIQKARSEEKAAALGVQAAEAKLAAARTSTGATAAKALAAAEQALITAQTRQEGSTLKVQAAEARLAAARAGTGKGAAASVLKAEQGLAAAMGQQKLTTHQLQVAETGLADVRASSASADASLLKNEQQLVTARSRQETAALRIVSVEDRLKAAMSEQKTITGQLAASQVTASKSSLAMQSGFALSAAAGKPLAGGLGKVAGGVKSVAVNTLATLKPLAGMAAGFGAILGVGKVISLGNEYTRTMNELQAVSGLNAKQMVKFSQATRDLGADLTLPATSGKDAAAVMLELAKGGLTANEALKAARGTIILAAAAQTDGATAAEIQSNSLNQFGLSAKKAGMVADVLANTANAASGGITDIAYSLKYVGPAARAVGANITTTAAAIGVLANQGLKGETAGTSLRSMLASLASPSKLAQKGLAGLGVEAFDASGKFLGLRSVVQQLSDAQKKMSQADFLDYVKKAFGKETLTAVTSLASAGVSGAKGYDAMLKSVSRTGGAATVAQSYMKGLGGSMDKLESQLEDVALGIYQTVAPALTSAVNWIADGLDGAGSKVSSFLSTAGGLGKLAITGAVTPQIGGIDPKVVAGIQAARGVIVGAYGDIVTFTKTQLVPSFGNIVKASAPIVAVVGGTLLGAFRAASWVLANGIGPALLATTGFLRDHKGAVFALAGMIGYLVLAYKAQQAQLAILEAGGMAKYLRATKLGVFWTNASTAAMTLSKVGLYLYRAAVFTAVVATQGWTAAQEILNVALIANPVGLLVTGIVLAVAAIAALVAGVVWAYKNLGWFRTAVDAVWAGIKIGVKAVGDAAVWLWRTVFVPALQGIGDAATWLWGTVLRPTFDGIVTGAKAVGGWFVSLWTNYIAPSLSAIGNAVSYLYSSYIDPIFQLIGAIIMKLVVPAFMFLWTGVIRPVFGWIGGLISAWWVATKGTFSFVIDLIRTGLGVAFSWLYNSIVKPVFGFIAFAISAWWTGTKIVFSAVTSFLRTTLGPVFSWLYRNAVKPAFDLIKTLITATWTNGVKPVFDKLVTVAKVTIPAAFSFLKDQVSKAWNKIADAAKVPIRFVVETVINDGIIGNFNKAADFFGTKKMPKVSLPKGFAGGGVIPGYSSRKRDDHLRPMRAGEGVLVPEVVRALGPQFVHGLNAAGNSGGVSGVKRAAGYAKGGIVGAATGAWDWVAGKAGKAWDWTKDAASTAASVVSDPAGTLGKLVKGIIGKIPGAGGMLDAAKGMGGKILNGVIDKLKGLGNDAGVFGGNGQNGNIPSSALAKASGFAPGPGVGATGGLLRRAAAAAWNAASTASGGILRLTEGYRDLAAQNYRWGLFKKGGNLAAAPGTSKHGLGDAADVAGGQSWLRTNGARYGWANTGLGFSQREPWHFEFKGAPSGGSAGKNIPTYDNGGMLPTGLSLVANNTGRPEPVLTTDQFDALSKGRGGNSDGGPHFHYEGRDFTPEDYMEAEHRMEVLRG